MTEKGYSSIYTTYAKTQAVALLSSLRENNVRLIYKTSTETTSDDVLYEICVADNDVAKAHNIIINLRLNNQE